MLTEYQFIYDVRGTITITVAAANSEDATENAERMLKDITIADLKDKQIDAAVLVRPISNTKGQ